MMRTNFREIGGKSSAKDIFLTFASDFLTEAPALEHLFRITKLRYIDLCSPPLFSASSCVL
jgi:hypothetical protein